MQKSDCLHPAGVLGNFTVAVVRPSFTPAAVDYPLISLQHGSLVHAPIVFVTLSTACSCLRVLRSVVSVNRICAMRCARWAARPSLRRSCSARWPAFDSVSGSCMWLLGSSLTRCLLAFSGAWLPRLHAEPGTRLPWQLLRGVHHPCENTVALCGRPLIDPAFTSFFSTASSVASAASPGLR